MRHAAKQALFMSQKHFSKAWLSNSLWYAWSLICPSVLLLYSACHLYAWL